MNPSRSEPGCKRGALILFWLLWSWFAGVAAVAGTNPAERVIVLANQDDEESVRLARHYLEARQIPEDNLIVLSMPRGETISWEIFWEKIYNPLQTALIEERWIEGFASRRVDQLGRSANQTFGHRISYLVVCRGVPLRIQHDPALLSAEQAEALPAEQRTNRAAVDQVLALLAVNHFPINGFIPNPLFAEAQSPPAARDLVVRVSRLDGPTLRTAQAMVDQAILAERQGLRGRAYIDLAAGRPHPVGDEWLKRTGEILGQHHFPLTVDESRAVLGTLDRFDAPAFYFGWYATHAQGPMMLSGFRFPPGAIGFHIHSFSAQTLRSRDRQWVGPLISRGITATVGNVYEPYLGLTHRPDILVEALLNGNKRFGDAVWEALPTLAWQSIALGDPLYQPQRLSLAEQVAHPPEGSQRNWHQYSLMREMNRLTAAGQQDEALRLGEENLELYPSLPLAEDLARRQSPEQARDTLAFLRYTSFIADRELGLALEVADFLLELNEIETGLGLFERLGNRMDLPAELRKEILSTAIDRARKNHRSDFLLRMEPLRQALGGD